MNPQETLSQLGTGISGALAYTGTNTNFIKFGADNDTLYLRVNGRKGYDTQMTVKLDIGSDTYVVGLLSMPEDFVSKAAKLSPVAARALIVEDERTDVYADELQSVFESMYDKHMKAHNGGFIPTGA